ncbi:GNAT family N-acetyltransferase [Candidatus Poribacteria bacterium]|nr:MAG: GNAT family N-acetyltransferase [Candidatus Poribacteria bacterium]
MSRLSSPLGAAIKPIVHLDTPRQTDYEGKFIVLSPVNPQVDAEELYRCTHGSDAKEQIWTYMSYGPFASVHAMQRWLEVRAKSKDPLFFTVHHRESKRRVGMVSFLNIVSDMGRLELGHIWYSLDAQKSNVNTESAYLMLREAFDRLKYRRVEWKCDSLNERSRLAALRLGFQFEGIFRQHMIVKDRNRDTAWYSMLDNEWADVKKNMEMWLYQNPDQQLSLTTLNSNRS